jgi:hypothetical protein
VQFILKLSEIPRIDPNASTGQRDNAGCIVAEHVDSTRFAFPADHRRANLPGQDRQVALAGGREFRNQECSPRAVKEVLEERSTSVIATRRAKFT